MMRVNFKEMIVQENSKNWSKPQVLVILPKTKANAIIRRYLAQ